MGLVGPTGCSFLLGLGGDASLGSRLDPIDLGDCPAGGAGDNIASLSVLFYRNRCLLGRAYEVTHTNLCLVCAGHGAGAVLGAHPVEGEKAWKLGLF